MAPKDFKYGTTGGFKRGMVELLLLVLLSEGDKYGYQLSQELTERSNGLFVLKETSMYPTLYRLLEKGVISDREEVTGKRRIRVYYHLEETGKQYLELLKQEYFAVTIGAMHVLGISSLEEMKQDEEL